MLMLRSKQGQIRCKKGQSVRTFRAVAFQVTNCTRGGARLRFVTADMDVPRIRTPSGGRYAFRKGQKFLVAPSMVLTVIRCRNGSVRMDVQAVSTRLSSFQEPKGDYHHGFVHTNLRHSAGGTASCADHRPSTANPRGPQPADPAQHPNRPRRDRRLSTRRTFPPKGSGRSVDGSRRKVCHRLATAQRPTPRFMPSLFLERFG